MKQTAMQQLLAQLKDERANLPMSKEWDRCYQAIEMAIQNTYLPMEKEQIIDTARYYFHEHGKATPEQYYNEIYGGNDEQPKFKIGDKLEALEWDKEEHNIEYVTITSINMENKVYHWETKLNRDIGGTLSSGYYFHESKAYEPKNIITKHMENKKQTAVEWLWEQVDMLIPYQDETKAQLFIKLKEQAMEMEKEQIKHTYLTCWKDYTGWDGKHWEMGRDPNETFNEYYNETFIVEDLLDWDVTLNDGLENI